MAHDDDLIYILYKNDGNIIINWGFSVFLDTDQNPQTGYKGKDSSFPIGADYMIEGNLFWQFNGNSQNKWQWNFVSEISYIAKYDTAEFSFPRHWIQNPYSFNGSSRIKLIIKYWLSVR